MNVYRVPSPPPPEPPAPVRTKVVDGLVVAGRAGVPDEPFVVDVETRVPPQPRDRFVMAVYAAIVLGMIIVFVLGFDPHGH